MVVIIVKIVTFSKRVSIVCSNECRLCKRVSLFFHNLFKKSVSVSVFTGFVQKSVPLFDLKECR